MRRRPVEHEIANPDPAGTIESLGSLGYTPEAAIADLVDNSISADARNVWIHFHWAGAEESTVAVVDDGHGMSEAELIRGMTIGARGVGATRSGQDLGRFGVGLKTASFSQCRQLVVSTRPPHGQWSTRTWDLDLVLRSGEWRLLKGYPGEVESQLAELAGSMPHGTIVVWRRLRRLVAAGSQPADEWAQREFYGAVNSVERHLSMTFGRYFTRKHLPLRIWLNGQHALDAWDPFCSTHPFVQRLPSESLPVEGTTVEVTPWVLPHRSRFDERGFEAAGGPRGWLEQQGFYIHRNERLIVAGEWLGLGFRKDDRHVLARISVDVPTALDSAWSVDVKKSTASPPPALVTPFRRIAKATRERASNVMTHRGKVAAGTRSQDFIYAWQPVRKYGLTSYRINRNHPLVREALSVAPESRSTITALLRLVEETLPIGLIRAVHASEAEREPEPFEGATPEEVLVVARQIFEALVHQGTPPREAARRLQLMPPFNDYPDLLRELGVSDLV
jgi:hypothetical protein